MFNDFVLIPSASSMSFGMSVSPAHSPSEGNSQCVRGRQFASNDNDSPIDAQLFVLKTRKTRDLSTNSKAVLVASSHEDAKAVKSSF